MNSPYEGPSSLSQTPAARSVATLSRDLADFLVEFSIVLHKRAMYPLGHPHLQESTERFVNRLESLLAPRDTLAIGIARHQLIVVLGAYGFVASVLPVWLLLCPRDYLSSFMKIGTIAFLILGVVGFRKSLSLAFRRRGLPGPPPSKSTSMPSNPKVVIRLNTELTKVFLSASVLSSKAPPAAPPIERTTFRP